MDFPQLISEFAERHGIANLAAGTTTTTPLVIEQPAQPQPANP